MIPRQSDRASAFFFLLATIAMMAIMIVEDGRGAAAAIQAARPKSNKNACHIQLLKGGQFITQTAGKAGTITVYVDQQVATTVSSLNQPYYATSNSKAIVRGYDQYGLVC